MYSVILPYDIVTPNDGAASCAFCGSNKSVASYEFYNTAIIYIIQAKAKIEAKG